MTAVIGVLISIICFAILVTSHELGHFLAGKALDFQINEFSVGMGPLVWSKTKGETQYSLRAIPIGGFCAFEGEQAETNDDDEIDIIANDNPRAFSNKPWWSKIAVLLAGPFVNIILSILIFTGLFMYLGYPSLTIDSVTPGKGADLAGIMAGDRIVAVEGIEVSSFSDVQQTLAQNNGDKVCIDVERNNERLSFECELYLNEYGNKAIGIYSRLAHPLKPAFDDGVRETGIVFVSIVDFFRGLFRGTTSADDITGVVGIVSIMTESYSAGFINIIYIFALIMANLGYMNLLPFPALDGGRVLMVLISKISGGKVSPKAEAIVNGIGMAILMILMIVLIFKDSIALLR